MDLPPGTFTGAGVKTVILFFEKGTSSRKIWYYKLNLNRNLGKNNPLNEEDLHEFLNLQMIKANSQNSWTLKMADVNTETYDLSVKNPNKREESYLRRPQEILEEMKAIDKETANILDSILSFI